MRETNWRNPDGTEGHARLEYDERSEIVFYDDEHVQISRLVRTYDERGRVTAEEQQIVSPRAFTSK